LVGRYGAVRRFYTRLGAKPQSSESKDLQRGYPKFVVGT